MSTPTTLDALTAALLNLDDPVAPRALADYLEEVGDARAADVRQLADVVPVVPIHEDSYLTLGPEGDEEARPLACGPWWSICLDGLGVTINVYGDWPQGRRLDQLHYALPEACHDAFLYVRTDLTPQAVGVAFEKCRRTILGAILDRPMMWGLDHVARRIPVPDATVA